MTTRSDELELVLTMDQALFNDHDLSVLDTMFTDDYVEHSPLVENDAKGLGEFVQSCGDGLKHEIVRSFSDGDLVVLHGRYDGIEEDTPYVGFDVYRVAGGKIAEHWDGLVELAEPNPSGRTQLDGPTSPNDAVDAEEARRTVTAFFDDVLIGQNYDNIARYTDGDTFTQHASDISDGADAMREFLQKLKDDGEPLVYNTRHRAIASGDMVLTQSDGEIGGERHFFYELWRVDQGADGELHLAELWDSIGPLPADEDMKHDHGAF